MYTSSVNNLLCYTVRNFVKVLLSQFDKRQTYYAGTLADIHDGAVNRERHVFFSSPFFILNYDGAPKFKSYANMANSALHQ